MTRHTVYLPDHGRVAYGFDEAIGYFFQEFDPQGEIITNEDTLLTGLTHGRLLGRLEGIDGVPEDHRLLIALDLPLP